MTPEEKRQAVANSLGFKSADYLKWLDSAYEFEEVLIKREQAAGANAALPDYAIWERYCELLERIAKGSYGGALHATVAQRIDAYLELMRDVL